MKKIIIFTAVSLMYAAGGKAQVQKVLLEKDIERIERRESVLKEEKKEDKKELRNLENKDVSQEVKQQFENDFEGVSEVSWQRMSNFDEASFMKNGEKVIAFYDDDAHLVGTTKEKSFAKLPYDAQEQIINKYKDYNVVRILEFTDNELNDSDMRLYNSSFNDKDSFFVELQKLDKRVVLQVSKAGEVSYFARLK